MQVAKLDEQLDFCIGELLHHREHTYRAETAEELTEIMEAVSLQLEERQQDFSFAIDGLTVTFTLKDS